MKRRHFGEICIHRDQRKAVFRGMSPDCGVICALHSYQSHMLRSRNQLIQTLTQFEAQVLIEQKLHFAVSNRRSRSAA